MLLIQCIELSKLKQMRENVVIIGGGIAGLEAAVQLASLGYNPILIEKEDHLGGHLADWHCLFPDMIPAKDVVSSLVGKASSVNIFTRTEVLRINRLRDSYNVMLSNGVSVMTRAILLATGFRLFDAHKKEEYGYGIYNQVITNSDLEKWFNGNPDSRIDNSHISSAGFVHCVGSRDEKAGNPQCSKVCCITAIKQAIELKKKFPEMMVWCFYMDLRMFGKKYEDFYISAQRDYGIRFIRGRVSEVSENIEGKVVVKAEDTLAGRPVKVTLDLLVLMSGMVCNPQTLNEKATWHFPIDSDGFLKCRNTVADFNLSPQEGIFLAGACTGPKTVPETIAEARSAALSIHNWFNSKE